jgi:dolichol-phosphate mannosyltransferase
MRQKSPFLLSVIVPCFNEAKVVELTHKRLISALGSRAEFALEILYINDGSLDQTEEMLFALADFDDRIKVISSDINQRSRRA